MPLSRYAGVLGPAELEMMWNVFHKVSSERGIDHDDQSRENLAAEIVRLYGFGLVTDEALMDALRGKRASSGKA